MPSRKRGSPSAIERIRHRQEADAATAWQRLDAAQQQRLAWEAASSRAHELRQAYPSLAAIGAGFRVRGERRRKGRKRGRLFAGTVTNEPCVVFSVKRKWERKKKATRVRRKGHLPHCLLAYVNDPANPGARTLVAVPTDVREMRKAKPHAAGDRGTIVARRLVGGQQQRPGDLGVLTCIVTLPGQGTQRFGMGAHHVLAMSLHSNGQPVDRAAIVLQSQDTEIGTLVSQPIGALLPGQEAFDAALARIDAGVGDPALLEATAGMRARSIWDDPGSFPVVCQVLVALGQMLPATFKQRRVIFGDDPDELVYFSGRPDQPIHPAMLEFEIDASAPRSTERGESGCPVVTAGGDTLVGMHIGGTVGDTRTIWVLPATDLFHAPRWGMTAPPELVSLS